MGKSLTGQKEWARLLFTKEKMTQKEIAAKVGVREATISKWVTTGNWEKERASIMTTRHAQLVMWYQQLDDLNKKIIQRDEGSRYPQGNESDTISKLSAAIRALELETSVAETINVLTRVLEHGRKNLPFEKVQEFSQYLDSYIKSLI